MDYQTILASFDYDWTVIASKLYREYDIKSSVAKDGRIIFKSKNMRVVSTPSAFDGCIFSTETMKMLSKMDVYCRSKEVGQFLPETTFEEFYDGTSLGVYYFEDQWVLRSINGYDVSDLSFYGNTKFGELVGETLNELPLDPKYCYSFSVKNTDFHPFLEGQSEPIRRIIHTATFDLATGERVDQDIGLPKPRTYVFESVADLRAQLFNSIKVFRKLSVPPNATPKLVGEPYTKNIFHGVIARSSDGTNHMFHSELYALISRLMYTNKYNAQLYDSGIERNKFMPIVASFNEGDTTKYLCLCPQTAPIFAQINAEYKKIVDTIFDRARSRSLNIKDKYFEVCSMFARFHFYPKDKYTIQECVINADNLVLLARLIFG
jgi:hypothetical protein